jgi:hypothetical protein
MSLGERQELEHNTGFRLLKFTDGVEFAQRCGVKEAFAHPNTTYEDRRPMVDGYRKALGDTPHCRARSGNGHLEVPGIASSEHGF